MARFILIFATLLLVLFSLEQLQVAQQAFIQPFTAGLALASAALMSPFDANLLAHGRVLSDARTGFAVSIESGCNGIEASIVLVAAVLAFPASWKLRLITVCGGLLAVQGLNILRIVSLYYLGLWNTEVFTFAHLYLWPVLIMLDVLLVFLLHLHFVRVRLD